MSLSFDLPGFKGYNYTIVIYCVITFRNYTQFNQENIVLKKKTLSLLLLAASAICTLFTGCEDPEDIENPITKETYAVPVTTEDFSIDNLSEDILVGYGVGAIYGTIMDCVEHRYIIHRDHTVDFYIDSRYADYNLEYTPEKTFEYIGTETASEETYSELEKAIDYNKMCRLRCIEPAPGSVCDGGYSYIYLFDKDGEECWRLGGSNVYGDDYQDLRSLVGRCASSAWEGKESAAISNAHPASESIAYKIVNACKSYMTFIDDEFNSQPGGELYRYNLVFLDDDDVPELLVDNQGSVYLFSYFPEEDLVYHLPYDLSYDFDANNPFDIKKRKMQAFQVTIDLEAPVLEYTYKLYNLNEMGGMDLVETRIFPVDDYFEETDEIFKDGISTIDFANGEFDYDGIINYLASYSSAYELEE